VNRQVTAAEMKAMLSALLDRAAAGEETIITRHGKPVAKLGPAEALVPVGRGFGSLRGQLKYPPDLFFEPPTEQDLKDWEGNLEELMAMTVAESHAYSEKLARKARRAKKR
jgi:prevent-host-death family protein